MTAHKDPMTKEELVARIERGRAALETLLRSVPDERLTAPGPDRGWSIKDHLAHLASWAMGIAAMLRREPRYEAMGLDYDFVARSSMAEINAHLEEQNGTLSLAEARERFDRAHQGILIALASLTNEDLRKTYSYFQPDEPGTDSGAPIVRWVAANTYEHYGEHLAMIRSLLGGAYCES